MKHFSKIVQEKCASNNDILFETLLNSSSQEFDSIINAISNSKRLQKRMLNSILTVFSIMKNQIVKSKCDNIDTVKLNFSAALSLLESHNIQNLVSSERKVLWKLYEKQIFSDIIFLEEEESSEQVEYMEDTFLYYESLIKKREREESSTSNRNVKPRI